MNYDIDKLRVVMETLPEMCSYGCGTCDRWTCASKEEYDACPRKETAERNKAIAAKFFKRHETFVF